MKSSELRLNNYICDAFGGMVQVRGYTKGGIYIRDEGFPAPEQAFSGIELTPEWLLKFGIPIPYGDQDAKFRLCSDDWGYIVNCNGIDIAHIRYIHQLQNLYFALTAHELEIKEG